MRTAITSLFLVALVVTSASAETLSGKISFESKEGCEGLKTGLRIVTKEGSAEFFIGKSSDGVIKTDASGKFLGSATSTGLKVSGSIKSGTLVRRETKVSGGCKGTFSL
ncbi:hypothetical protein IZ6_08250 [Terrihabitans soli]|uniref:DUF5666 domain-containing protein n=1 Tax=Terrihabitans soli TaxID=708113 RepID=A0A6S6QT19_9HYPH|nr:hypothetical protein [Terrihabitans soli]BCJ90090.1 hypothetical protein IZ6_08250 [Terrihabitans soli]